MLKDPDVRKQFVIGIAASLVVALLIQPLLGWVWQGLDSASNAAIVMVSNVIYRNAAHGLDEHYSFGTLTLLFGVLTGGLSGTGIVLLVVRPRLRRLSESIEHHAEGAAVSTSRWARSTNLLLYALLPILVLSILFIMVVETGSFRLNSTFNQTLAAVGPALDDMQIRKYRSRWALMRSRADYEAIKRDLMKVADDHGIQLPEYLRD
jgi:hypothetical protein